MIRPLAILAFVALGSSALAVFAPVAVYASDAYAGTNGGFNFAGGYVDLDLTGQNGHSITRSVFAPSSGAETAVTHQWGILQEASAWVLVQTATQSRASTSGALYYRFIPNVASIRVQATVQLSNPLVWWDDALVRVSDVTAGVTLFDHARSNPGVFNEVIAVDPLHTIQVYVGTNQNNLNGFSYPAGDTQFTAEALVTPVPEPASLAIVGLGLVLLIKRRR